MSTPVEPASLSDPFESMADLVTLNGWADRAQLDAARADLIKSGKQTVLGDKRALGRFLVERRLLTSEQMTELDLILQQQANFPNYQLLKKLGLETLEPNPSMESPHLDHTHPASPACVTAGCC